jgi:hypothetical protein
VWILTSKQCLPDVNLIQNDQAILEMVSSERLGIVFMESNTHAILANSCDASTKGFAQNTPCLWAGFLALGVKTLFTWVKRFLLSEEDQNLAAFRGSSCSMAVQKQRPLFDMGFSLLECSRDFRIHVDMHLLSPKWRNAKLIFRFQKRKK